MDFKLSQRVVLTDGIVLIGGTGTVVGFGSEVRMPEGRFVPIVLVRLDEGFYTPGKTGYVSLMAVHPDNLEEE